LVSRPRLINQLQLGIQRPLTIIAAPAGFGKTTLLSTWLELTALRFAWVSLEHNDDELTRFWSYVFTALAQDNPGSEVAALSLLQGSPLQQLPPIESVLNVWINSLTTTLSHETILILDDYHLITASQIHQSILYLLDHLPHRFHLVISTRADPPLPLARLRMRGHLTEIRAADLRFNAEESATFLTRTTNLNLSDEDIAILKMRTEGWIAGLRLAALSMQGREDISAFLKAFKGSQRYIIDYLVEEVLSRQPEAVQIFLLQTAILERLQASLCEAVIGMHGEEISGQAMLEQLEQANLFLVPLDDERLWYRYHQLFAEALRHRLQSNHPSLVPELHRRASAWYEQQGLLRDAIHHALAATDFTQAAYLIEQTAESTMMRGELATLGAWLEALPDELLRSRMELCLWQGWLLALSGQFDAAERLLHDIECILHTNNSSPTLTISLVKPPQLDKSDHRQVEYSGRIAAIRAFIAFRCGDAQRTIELALQALEQLPDDQVTRGLVAWYLGIAYLWSGDTAAGATSLNEARRISQAAGNSYAAFMATFELARMQARQSYLHQADQSYQQAMELVADRGKSSISTGPIFVGRGELQREWNHLDAAADFLQDGIARCQQMGNASILLVGHITLIRVKQAQEDATGADVLIQKIPQILRSSRLSPLNEAQFIAWHVRLALAQGDLALAARWMQERQLRIDDELISPRDIEYLTLARVLIAQQRPDEALSLLERLLNQAEREGRMGDALEILVLQVVAQQACGDEEEAMERLSQALSLAEPEGYIRLFVDEGEPMAQVLMQMHRRPLANQSGSMQYRERLLALLGKAYDEDMPHAAVSGLGKYPLSEPLSQRELEVLRLIIAGYSNREIADQLVIAVSTVKWYINAIYGKLQVESRTRAIARSRELNIV
jgi:LuxR family maltose regulon positive regulatory protein